mmetsp:Transcript_27818/g.65392  ORF Transcript_27818/g.65392 Transcript_27818/m.65392 type:complete len:844 (+) Transcript_27818:118-2649(+)|eukprot:CAMPEP_0197179204 /NCGR_PEP_ID=MMETSP1423-20130617/4236_1 /TAXON_ID=476441 /ORGANISM="Pseudo-nitzschia heimii, Strain UNC1101" /LENGTH=843 /DNA_ID=CAMNT_0042629089 /DNA_START=26 /DNA_END=2557 /DNA_ORIENTATION=+
MSGGNDTVDLDARSFNLDSVEIVEDDVDVQNELICEDRVGVDVNVDVNADGDGSHADKISVPIDEKKKKKFDRQRDEILSRVPEEVKARFGEIYFSTFGKFVGPVLIMNPYKVAPGLLRDQWLAMFHNCQKSGREKQMTHLTYWYGQFNDLQSAYSFQKTSQLLSYEKGMKKTERKLNIIHQKKDAGKKITSKELNFMKGFEEMEADRPKEAGERFGYVDSSFLEEYHVLPEEDSDEINPRQRKRQVKTTKTAPESKLKKKKKKAKKGEIATPLEVVEKGELPRQIKKKSKKRIKKGDSAGEMTRAKKKLKTTDDDNHDAKKRGKSTMNLEKENHVDQKDNLKGSLKKDDDAKEIFNTTSEDKKLSNDEEFAGIRDVSSHGEVEDGSLKIGELESDEDMADEDYIENPKATMIGKKSQKTRGKVENQTTKLKEVPQKKTPKTKIKKSSNDGDQKSIDSKKLMKKEQSKFHNCEKKYLPLLRRWENVIRDKNATQISRIFDELLESMEHFTAPFIEEYNMSDLMKRSKGYNNEKRKKVLAKFKTIYERKKKEVPKSFKATKKSENLTSSDVKIEAVAKEEEQLNAPNMLKVKENRMELISTTDDAKDKSIPKDSLSSKIVRKSEIKEETTHHVMLEPTLPKSSKLEVKHEGTSQKQMISSSKAEKRKRFSLGNLMRVGSSSSRQANVGTKPASMVDESPAFASKTQTNNHKNPSWTMQNICDGDFSNENRSFGLEFLQQAALYIPDSKTINYDAVARNIETAIYKWSTESIKSRDIVQNVNEESWLNRYWDKVHDIAACISGKYKVGTLAKMICDGKFATPDELVCLPDAYLLSYFEGLPISKC